MDMDDMKKIGKQMNIYMGTLMSFALSLVGNLTSGHFSIKGFIMSFLISLVISIMIGFVVPIGQINKSLSRQFDLKPHHIVTRIVESFVSDLIYTPLLTLIMVAFSVTMASKSSGGKAQIPILPAFLGSLWICFIVGFILIFIFQPMLLRFILKKEGLEMPEERR